MQRLATEKIRIDHAPRAVAPQPQHSKADNNDHALDGVDPIEGDVVLAERGLRVHPREHDEGV